MTLEIKTADELVDPELEARWAVRWDAREGDILRRILRTFVDRGGPVPVEAIAAAFPDRPPETVWDTLVGLDDEDLIQIREGRIDVAYPFSALPTPFVVVLASGEERYVEDHDGESARHGLLVDDLTVVSRGERVSFVQWDRVHREECRRRSGGPRRAGRQDRPDGRAGHHGR